jgi:hypothetical protein
MLASSIQALKSTTAGIAGGGGWRLMQCSCGQNNRAAAYPAGSMLDNWVSRADAMFAQCTSHPGVLAFMMDHWADMLEQPPAASTEAGVGGTMPVAMLEWLVNKVQVRPASLYVHQAVNETRGLLACCPVAGLNCVYLCSAG